MIRRDRNIDWCNVSLQEYIDLQDLLLNNTDELEKEDLVMQQVQILYNRNPYNMGLPEFRKCVEGLKFLNKEMPKMKVRDQYNLGGNVYTLHKSLSDFRLGQYIDYERIMKDKKGVEMYASFIALFLTPSQCDIYGDGYDVGSVIEDINKYMSIADACSIAAFFLRLSKACTVRFLWYSMHKATRKIKDRKTRRDLRKKTRQLAKSILGELPLC